MSSSKSKSQRPGTLIVFRFSSTKDSDAPLYRLDVAHYSTDYIYRIAHVGARRVLKVQDEGRPGSAVHVVHAGPLTEDSDCHSQAEEDGRGVR